MLSPDHTHIVLLSHGFHFTNEYASECKSECCEIDLLDKIFEILKRNLLHTPQHPDALSRIPPPQHKQKLFELANAIYHSYVEKQKRIQSNPDHLKYLENIHEKIKGRIYPEPFLKVATHKNKHEEEQEFLTIPNEIVQHIFSFLSLRDLSSVSAVNIYTQEQAKSVFVRKAHVRANLFWHYNAKIMCPINFLEVTFKALDVINNNGSISQNVKNIRNRVLSTTDKNLPEEIVTQSEKNEIIDLANTILLQSHLITKKGSVGILSNIIDSIASIVSFGDIFKRPLKEHNTLEKIHAVLNLGLNNLNCTNKLGRTPLHFAVWSDNFVAAHMLLSGGANPNIIELKKGLSPADLVWQNMEMLNLLLSYGAQPRGVIDALKRGMITLNHLEMIVTIIFHTPKEEIIYTDDNIPQLVLFDNSFIKLNYDVYKAELKDAINDFFCHSSYMYEQTIDALTLFKTFLGLGVNVDVRDPWKRTAFHYAIWNQREDIARLLLKHGADPQAEDDQGKTPFALAQLFPAMLDVFKII